MADSYSCSWTRYRLVTPGGETRRLLKVAGPCAGVTCLRLRAATGTPLGEETPPHNASNPWHFGFWVPEHLVAEPRFVLEVTAPGGVAPTRFGLSPAAAGPADALPLRLDRLGTRLQTHLADREVLPDAAALADFVPDLAAYLQQHRLVYERPAEHWGEGLPLGNGSLGVTVTGQRGASQTFFLDRCDLWAASPSGKPYGRVFAGRLDLSFAPVGGRARRRPQSYLQELSLHAAEVRTCDGALTTVARVNAARDVLEVFLHWRGRGRLRLQAELSKDAIPLLDEGDVMALQMANGSWEAVYPQSAIQAAKERVAAGPHSQPRAIVGPGAPAVLDHALPNLRYAMAAAVKGLAADWRDASRPRRAATTAELVLPPGGNACLLVAVTSDRVTPDPVASAIGLADAPVADAPSGADEHRTWWARYWRRTFVELPDKLMENLWYFGAYHQAAFSRSPTAPGFFGLWHPLDHRTWQESHVADAQTALLYWAPFAINHLELLLSSHHSFAELFPAFLRYNPGEGALVPHMFAPEWAGGKATFGRKNPHKGSIAWMGLTFWWDYLHTRDRQFLADVAYPVIAALADYHLGDLVRGPDGRLHCLDSQAAEQSHTDGDNCYDRALIGAILRAAAEAAETLAVEPERARAWRQALADLFDFPADATTLLETAANPHPYRCHPVVLFGVHPGGCIEPGSPLWSKANATFDVVTNLFGFHYEDRHETIPGHRGGQEPNGHATSFLMHAAARLRGWPEVRRLFYALAVRTQLKRNGLRSISDPRHDHWLSNMAISEATSGQTSGMSEVLLQNYSDHTRVLAVAGTRGTFRFSGLRAYGGFVLAGECIDGRTTAITVHSLCGGRLRLANPWPGQTPAVTSAAAVTICRLADGGEGLDVCLPPGQTCRLATGPAGPVAPPLVEARRGPRCVSPGDWSDFEPPVVYYPEDLPLAQETPDGRVYLGMPAVEPAGPPPCPAWEQVVELSRRSDWQARQTAARWLARFPSSAATGLLEALARADAVPVVCYTAGVSLVRQGTPAALGVALRVARDASAPHVRREILKAVGRLSHSASGAALLAATFGDVRISGRVLAAE